MAAICGGVGACTHSFSTHCTQPARTRHETQAAASSGAPPPSKSCYAFCAAHHDVVHVRLGQERHQLLVARQVECCRAEAPRQWAGHMSELGGSWVAQLYSPHGLASRLPRRQAGNAGTGQQWWSGLQPGQRGCCCCLKPTMSAQLLMRATHTSLMSLTDQSGQWGALCQGVAASSVRALIRGQSPLPRSVITPPNREAQTDARTAHSSTHLRRARPGCRWRCTPPSASPPSPAAPSA